MLLSKKFFNQPALKVAESLLGKYICVRYRGHIEKYKIQEVEAYYGPEDKASHASRGITPRTEVMFGPAGYWYVYFTYGMHWMLNIVTGKKGYPAAVLIRGVEGTNGPARVTKLLGVDKRFNRKIANRTTGLWIEDLGARVPKKEIQRASRIGVSYAGLIWANKKYRFYILDKK